MFSLEISKNVRPAPVAFSFRDWGVRREIIGYALGMSSYKNGEEKTENILKDFSSQRVESEVTVQPSC